MKKNAETAAVGFSVLQSGGVLCFPFGLRPLALRWVWTQRLTFKHKLYCFQEKADRTVVTVSREFKLGNEKQDHTQTTAAAASSYSETPPTHTHTHTHTQSHTHTHITHKHTHIDTGTNTYRHTHTHIHTQSFISL